MTRLALVTGGAKRLGRELVLNLLSRDWDVMVHYFSSGESALGEIEERAKSLGRRVMFCRADLSTREGVDGLVQFACDNCERLDLLVNNASYFPLSEQRCADSYISNESEDEWDYTLALNARAPFFLIQKLAVLLMKNRGAGSNTDCNTHCITAPEQLNRSDGSAAQREALSTVINILDTCIDSPFVSRASYSVSKAALLTTTEIAARTFHDSVCIYGLVLGELDFTQSSELGGSDELGKPNTVAVGSVLDALGPLLANELPTATIVRITQ